MKILRSPLVTALCLAGLPLSSLAYDFIARPDDSSAGSLAFSASQFAVTESAGSITIGVVRSSGDSGSVSVSYSTSGGTATAGSDYTATNGTLSWAAGETGAKFFTINVNTDAEAEGTETVNLNLTGVNGGASLGTSQAVLSISDDASNGAGQLSFSASTFRVQEAAGQVVITVNRINGTSGTVSVAYTVADGSATSGSDYRASSGTLTWADGDNSPKTFSVEVINDSVRESEESINLTLSSPSGGGALGTAQATILIASDDSREGDDLTTVAQNPTQVAIAEAINNIDRAGTASPELQQLFDTLYNNIQSDPNGVANALQQIAPEEILSQGRLTQSALSIQQSNIESRLYSLRRGVGCVDVSQLNGNIDGESVSAQQLLSPDPACADAGKLRVFVNGDFSTGEKEVTRRESGFDFDTQGMTLGADYRFKTDAILGAAIGYVNTEADLHESAGAVDMDGYSLSLYGTYYQTQQVFFDWIYSYSNYSFDNERAINYQLGGDVVDQTALSDNDGIQHSFGLGIGYHYNYKRFSVLPSMRLTYAYTELDGFNESTGAGQGNVLGLHVNDQDFDSLQLRAGYDVVYTWPQNWGLLMPMTSLHMVHEFKEDRRYLSGFFLEDSQQNEFAIGSERLDHTFATFGLGVLAQFSRDWQAYVNYEALLTHEEMSSHSVTAGVQVNF